MNNLDQIKCDIVVYLHPEYFEWDYKDKIDTRTIDRKKLDVYYLRLSAIDHFYKKILRYELYFSEFYPDSQNIPATEALEHHIHAYLEDVHALQEKIKIFLEILKKDLKAIAQNKKEIESAFKLTIENLFETFKNNSDVRNPHHHQGFKFLDSDLVDADLSRKMLLDSNPLKIHFKPEILDTFKKNEDESFEKAKKRWIAIAQHNNAHMEGFLNDLFKNCNELIRESLNIKPFTELMKKEN